jgi:transposase
MGKVTKMLDGLKELFIGLDIHKKFWVLSIIGDGEFIRGPMRIPASIECLLKILQEYRVVPNEKVHIVYEAGCFGFWLCQRLRELKYDCQVTPPSLIPVEQGNRVKTDRRDSRKLTYYLYCGMLKFVHVPSERTLYDRELTRTRCQLVSHRKDIERQIKGKLLFFGISIPEHSGKWSERFVEAIRASVSQTPLKEVIDALLKAKASLESEIKVLDRDIEALSKDTRYIEDVRCLDTMRGIGVLSAMTVLAELGDVRRFERSNQLPAFLGLTPGEYSSGSRIHRGHITHAGNKWVRTVLVEAAWVMIRYDKGLRALYERLKVRIGGKRAIVAVARRLACRLRQMLMKSEAYKAAA